jgi:hypothetical protein
MHYVFFQLVGLRRSFAKLEGTQNESMDEFVLKGDGECHNT